MNDLEDPNEEQSKARIIFNSRQVRRLSNNYVKTSGGGSNVSGQQ